MKKKLHRIDDLFYRYLNNYTEEPVENLWKKIEDNLTEGDLERYKKKLAYFRKLSICIVASFMALSLNDGSSLFYSTPKMPSIRKTAFAIEDEAQKTNEAGFFTSIQKNKVSKKFAGQKELSAYNALSSSKSDLHVEKLLKKNLAEILGETITKIDDPHIAFFGETKPVFKISENSASEQRKNKSQQQVKINKRHRGSEVIIPFVSFDHYLNRLQNANTSDEEKSEVKKREKPDPSFTFGLLAERQISEKVSIRSGFSFSTFNSSISPTIIKAIRDNSGQYKFKLTTTLGLAEIKRKNNGYQQGDSIEIEDGSLQLRYFSIPTLLKINFKSSKLSVSALTGTFFNLVTNDKVEISYIDANGKQFEKIQKVQGLKPMFISLSAAAEADYAISNKTGIDLAAEYHHAITAINKGTPVVTYPVNLALRVGVRFKL